MPLICLSRSIMGAPAPKGDDFAAHYENADVVLTSYGLSHADTEELSSVTWNTICLDEAQNIKNAHTKQSRAIRKLKGLHHIALSGTPMENRLTELWSIFDFMNKGYLGSLTGFHKRYVLPIEKDRDEKRIGQLQQLIRYHSFSAGRNGMKRSRLIFLRSWKKKNLSRCQPSRHPFMSSSSKTLLTI
nr:SNF2-related protein [Bacillus subtilis]